MSDYDQPLLDALSRLPCQGSKPKSPGEEEEEIMNLIRGSMGPPERIMVITRRHGYYGIVVNNGLGYLCGYVLIPENHPWHGENPDFVDRQMRRRVHGGITYSSSGLYDLPPGGRKAWWVGFDCAHFGDAPNPDLLDSYFDAPGLYEKRTYKKYLEKMHPRLFETHKDQNYVLEQIGLLCEEAFHAGVQHAVS
jgi:hypothetical protein